MEGVSSVLSTTEGVQTMCDYSLQHKASRPARVGEKLVTTVFSDASTRGLSSPDDPTTAVCVLPGTEISFSESVHTGQVKPIEALIKGVKTIIGIAPASRDRVATFTQVDKEDPHKHHDALKFADGNIVLLHDLAPGQEVTILTMPADPKTLSGAARVAAEKEQERAESI